MSETTRKPQIPGPRPIPLVGWRKQALAMMSDPIHYLMDMYETYGRIATWNPKKPEHVFVFGPEYNKRLLSDPELFISQPLKDLPIPPDSAMARLRSNLTNLNGERHKQHRQLMQPAFHRRHIEGFRDAMVEITQRELLERWKAGETRDIDPDLRRLTVYIAMRTIFSLDSPADVDKLNGLIGDLLRYTQAPTTMLFPFNLPGTSYRKVLETAEKIEAFIKLQIEAKRSDPEAHRDVLTMLIQTRDEHGEKLSDDELIGEAYAVFCHETSASTMSWTLFLLSQHPEVLSDLLDELDAVLGGDAPTVEQIPQLELLDRVIKESVRMLPGAAFGSRFSTAPAEFPPFEVDAGTAVFFSQFVSHRLPELYPEPAKFRPRRWETFKPTPYEFIPFGAGAHYCIGAAFAMLEIKIVLSMVLQKFRLTMVPDSSVDPKFGITLIPEHGLPMTLAEQDRELKRSPVKGSIHKLIDFD